MLRWWYTMVTRWKHHDDKMPVMTRWMATRPAVGICVNGQHSLRWQIPMRRPDEKLLELWKWRGSKGSSCVITWNFFIQTWIWSDVKGEHPLETCFLYCLRTTDSVVLKLPVNLMHLQTCLMFAGQLNLLQTETTNGVTQWTWLKNQILQGDSYNFQGKKSWQWQTYLVTCLSTDICKRHCVRPIWEEEWNFLEFDKSHWRKTIANR